jgi:hypothetical protein
VSEEMTVWMGDTKVTDRRRRINDKRKLSNGE